MRHVIMVRTTPATRRFARLRLARMGGGAPSDQAEALSTHLDVSAAIAILTTLGAVDLAIALRACQSAASAQRLARALLRLQRQIAQVGMTVHRGAPFRGLFRDPLATIVAPLSNADADEIAHVAAWLARTGRAGCAIVTYLDVPVGEAPGRGATAATEVVAAGPRRPAHTGQRAPDDATAPLALHPRAAAEVAAQPVHRPAPPSEGGAPSVPIGRHVAGGQPPRADRDGPTAAVPPPPHGAVSPATAHAAGTRADAPPEDARVARGEAAPDVDQSVAAALHEMAASVTPIMELQRSAITDEEDEHLPTWPQDDDGNDAVTLAG